MPVSNDQIQGILGKYISDPKKLALAVASLDVGTAQGPEGEGQLRAALRNYGVPEGALDNLVGVAQKRGADREAAQSKADEEAFGGLSEEKAAEDEAKAALAQGFAPDFSGFDFSQFDPAKEAGDAWRKSEEQRVAQERQAAADGAEADKMAGLDKQFGHDLAWLDPLFDQDQTKRSDVERLMGTTGDEQARDAQRRASGELFDLWRQGGQDAQDKLARSKARAESEDWLRGQREADMQNLAERGMSGSGAEIATLLGDRQNAASRLSMADQEASASAEQRAMDALLGGSKIESDIQGAADDYVTNNAKMISDIAMGNKDFKRDAYKQTMSERNAFQLGKLGIQTDAAQKVADRDQRDTKYGYDQSGDLAEYDADAFNKGQAGYNAATGAAYSGYDDSLDEAGRARIGLTGSGAKYGGQSASASGKLVMDIMGNMGGMGGAGGGK